MSAAEAARRENRIGMPVDLGSLQVTWVDPRPLSVAIRGMYGAWWDFTAGAYGPGKFDPARNAIAAAADPAFPSLKSAVVPGAAALAGPMTVVWIASSALDRDVVATVDMGASGVPLVPPSTVTLKLS